MGGVGQARGEGMLVVEAGGEGVGCLRSTASLCPQGVLLLHVVAPERAITCDVWQHEPLGWFSYS